MTGGLAHALDPAGDIVLCGADRAELEIFAVDFTDYEWGFRALRV
jgi:hypothetical protein